MNQSQILPLASTYFSSRFFLSKKAFLLYSLSITSILFCNLAIADCNLAQLKKCCADGGGDGCPKVSSCTFDDFAKIRKSVAQCTATPANGIALPGIIPQGSRPHHPRGTGYYPHSSSLEGGFRDRRGVLLHTLQDFLEGDVGWVSVAMDNQISLPYGTHLRILELEAKFNRVIDFRVVDTGGDFYDKGFDRIDICTRDEHSSLLPEINGTLTLIVLNTPPGDPVAPSLKP